MRPASLRARLAIGIAIGLVAFWIVGTSAALTALSAQTNALFDSALQETARRILPLAAMDALGRDEEDEAREQRVGAARADQELLTYVVRDAKGETILASADADAANFPPEPAPGFSLTATHRLYVEKAVSGALTLIVAEPLTLRREAAWRAAWALTAPLFVLAPLALLGVGALVGWSLRPVRRLVADIEARGGGDLRPLDSAGLPSEMTPVASALTRLMGRVRRTLDAERAFAANAAHELRTPIAAALAQTQRLVSEKDADRRRARAYVVEERLHALARLAEKLMQLARAQGAQLLAAEPADVTPALALTIEEARRGAGLGDRLTASLPQAPALSRVDPDALAIAARNLIENAARHGAAEGPVRVAFDGRTLAVANRGAVVPAQEMARLTAPFERGASQAQGSGLGLAIVAAIAAETGSRLDLFSPAPGEADGFEARLTLPA